MPLQPPSAYPAGSVMTRLWCHRAHFDGQLEKARIRISTSSTHTLTYITPTPPSSSSSSSSTATLIKPSVKFQSVTFKSDVIAKVKHAESRYVLLLLILLCLFVHPIRSKHYFNMQPNHVVFRSRICQPVSPTDLQKLMGSNFDKNRMAIDLANMKRTSGFMPEVPGNPGYQADEPRFGLSVESAYFMENAKERRAGSDIWVDAREENIYDENEMIDEIDTKNIVKSRTPIPGKTTLSRRIPNRKVVSTTSHRRSKSKENNEDFHVSSDSRKQAMNIDSYSYMRRRRKRSVEDLQPFSRSNSYDEDNPNFEDDVDENVNFDEYDLNDEDSDINLKDKKSSDSIQLRLFLRGKDKKTRKLLKKKLRQKAKNLNKPPPWECKFSQVHKRMRQGIFPDIILEGNCGEEQTCFYRLYKCEAIKYAVKLLQRDPEQCNPLPSVSNFTIYEEKWDLVQHHVTVGCSCSSPNTKNSKPKNRRGD